MKGIKCPHCNHTGISKVIDSRPREGNYIYRRRRCKWCNKTFSTAEITSVAIPDREKLKQRINKIKQELYKCADALPSVFDEG